MNPFAVSGAQIIAGGLISLIPGGQAIGIPLLIGGLISAAYTALAPRPGGSGGYDQSPTYGWDEISGAWEGAPRWYVLGEQRRPLDYLSAHTEQDGNRQYLYALLYAGEGGDHGVESISQVQINDQELEHFHKVTTEIRYGTSSQTRIQGFGKISIPWQDGTRLDKGDTWTWTTRRAVDEVHIVLAWLGGLYDINRGEIEKAEWICTVKWKDDGASDWTRYDPPSDSDWSKDRVKKLSSLKIKLWSKHEWGRYERSLSVVRGVMTLTWSTKKIRSVRIKSGRGDDLPDLHASPTVLRVEEIESDDRTYPGVCLVAVKALAKEQLSGGLPQFSALIRGWKVQNQGDSAPSWSRNPSKLIEAVLLDEDDGLGRWISTSDLDDGGGGSWRTVRDRCDADAGPTAPHKEARWQLDYVVDTQQPASEHLGQMLLTCRAQIIEVGGLLQLVQDVAGTANRIFDARMNPASDTRPVLALDDGRADIIEREIPQDERVTHLRIGYQDRDRPNYERRFTTELVDPDWTSGDPLIRREIYLAGVTRETQAMREGRYWMQRTRLRTRLYELGVGWGDIDLLPMDVISLSADYPTLSEQMLQVLAVTYAQDGRGRIYALEYDADAYADTTDSLPGRDWLTRAEALKRANQIPRGATNVVLTEVYGSTHLHVAWTAAGDVALRVWRVYLYDGSGPLIGRLQAEVDPDEREYLIRDVAEGTYVIRVLAVAQGGAQEDPEGSAGMAAITVTRRTSTPSEPANAAIAVAETSVSARVMVDAPVQSDPPQLVQIIRGESEDVGQLMAEVDVIREGLTGEGGQRVPSVSVPVLPGRRAGGADTTLVVRAVGRHGRRGGAAVTRSVPAFDLAGHRPLDVASIVGSTRVNFPAADVTDPFEYDATDGVRLRALPTGSGATSGSGWGTGSAGLLVGTPGSCRYLPRGVVTSSEIDLGQTRLGALECYDEAQRGTSKAQARPGRLWHRPGSPASRGRMGVGTGPRWAARLLRGDLRANRPLRRTYWAYRIGTSTPLAGAWLPYMDGAIVSGRYLQVRLTLADDLGLHRIISPRVYVRLWEPWSETGVPGSEVIEDVVTVSAPHLVGDGESVILASGTTTVTLPDAAARTGRLVSVLKTDAGGTTVTVTVLAGTINGASSQSLTTQWQSIRCVSDGADWLIVGRAS